MGLLRPSGESSKSEREKRHHRTSSLNLLRQVEVGTGNGTEVPTNAVVSFGERNTVPLPHIAQPVFFFFAGLFARAGVER